MSRLPVKRKTKMTLEQRRERNSRILADPEVRAMVGPKVGRGKRWSINIVFLTLLSILVLTPHIVWMADLPEGDHGCAIL